MAISFDLKAHDAQFHPNGYVEGKSKCKFREQMKDYESVDDLSKAHEITDALEDSELLDDMIASALDPETKKRLEGNLKDTQAILDAILGKGGASKAAGSGPTSYGPNAPIAHNKKAFPDKNDAKWQDALAHYGDSAYGWKSAGSGSTSPHYIDFNGKRYFVKKAGFGKATYTKEAARNEANANNFLRLAGLNAPDSMYLKSNDGGRFCISGQADISGGTLESHLGDRKVADQVKDAYPIMSLLYNMDIMQNADNAFVDKNGKALFLDNGSTFGFSAQGARNKYFDFDKREDPVNGNPDFLALANFKGNRSGSNWREAITGDSSKAITLEDGLKLAAKYDMGALAREAQKQGLMKQMPQNGQDAFIKYADELDKLSAKYKQKKPSVAAPAGGAGGTTTSVQQQGGGKQNQSEIEKLAKKYGLNVPTLKDNGDGTKTLTGFGSNVDFGKLREFVKELNANGLIPGFLASLSQTGALTAAPALNSSTLANQFSQMGGMTPTNSGRLASTLYSGSSSSGSYSFGSGFFSTSSAASNFANLWNSSNPNSGYTAKATQNAQTGAWEVTLYPTNAKQIAQTYGGNSSSPSPSQSGSAKNGSMAATAAAMANRSGLSAKAAARLQKMAGAKTQSNQSAQQNKAAQAAHNAVSSAISNALNASSSSQKPSSPHATRPAAPVQTPAPTITPAQQKQVQQVQAMPPAQRAKAIGRLQRMMNAPSVTASQKASYQAMVDRMVGSANNGATV